MSTLRVNQIVNFNDNGPVEFTKGIILPAEQTINGDLIINSAGIVTASVFSGDGANVTNIQGGISKSKSLALTFIL